MTGDAEKIVTFLIGQDRSLIWDLSPHKDKRSKDANALMWHCIGEIARAVSKDKWEVYLDMLKHYGQFTYVLCKPQAVDKLRKSWRETEVVGEVNVNGQKSVQVLCYYGSSTYNSTEFSKLLDGIINEMEQMDLEPPMPREVQEALKEWEKQNQTKGR